MTLPAGFTEVSTIARSAAMYDTPAKTNSQTVSGIWSTTDPFPKYLFLRGNSDFTTYDYVKLAPVASEIGCVVAGQRTVLDTFTLPVTGLLQANQNYQYEATDFTFNVTGPGGLNHSFSEGSTPVSQMGDDYVYGAFGTDGNMLPATSYTTPGTYTYDASAANVGDLFEIQAWDKVVELEFGTDIPSGSTSWTVVVAGSGLPSTVTIPGYGTVSSADGTSGSGVHPVNIFRVVTTVPGSMYSWAFSDSGPTTGPAVDSLPGTQGILSSPSGTFMDLPTPGPAVTVNIGPSKFALVSFGVNQMWGAAAGTDGIVAVKCTGANTIDADTTRPCLRYHTPATGQVAGDGTSRSDLWEFDNEGATEFALQYASTGGHTVTFDTPSISVLPL